MNYLNFFKRAGKTLIPEGMSISELKKGIIAERKNTLDDKMAAKIAMKHLKEDAQYYSKLSETENVKECGCVGECDCEPQGNDVQDNGGLPLMGGALAVPHVGQPIHMSKIITVGSQPNGQMASGDLSGYTSVNGRGVTKDTGGIPATSEGDKEPITAGGHKVSNDIATKSVGGEVVSGEGQQQGGPNTKGTIANTAKMNEGKTKIREMVKDVLKEITFDKKSGKWVKINEVINPRSYAIHLSKLKNKLSALHGNIKRSQNPAIIEKLKAQALPIASRINNDLDEYKRIFGKEFNMKKLDLSVYQTGNQGQPPANPTDPNIGENTVNMKMGPSYKTANPQYRTAEDDQARTVQYEPEITEMYDEEEECKMESRFAELANAKRTLNEDEIAELNDLAEKCSCEDEDSMNEGQCEDFPSCGHGYNRFGQPDCPGRDEHGNEEWSCAGCGKKLPTNSKSSLCPQCIRKVQDASDDPTGQDLDNLFGNDMEESSHKVVSPTQARTSDDDHARTVQFDPEMTETHEDPSSPVGDDIDLPPELRKARKQYPPHGIVPTSVRRDNDEPEPNISEPLPEDSDIEDDDPDSFESRPVDDDPLDDFETDDVAGNPGACPECGNTKGNIGMGDTAQCARCGLDYEVEKDENPESDLHSFDAELSDKTLGKIAQIDVEPMPEPTHKSDEEDQPEPTEGLEEAGGGVVQHRSYRTVGDLPQKYDARWGNEVDEATKPHTPKDSETAKKIKKSLKTKKSVKDDQLKHKTPRSTKSGVHKRK